MLNFDHGPDDVGFLIFAGGREGRGIRRPTAGYGGDCCLPMVDEMFFSDTGGGSLPWLILPGSCLLYTSPSPRD